MNTAKKDPSWKAFPWASNKRENEELILDETQELFIWITANEKKMPLRDRAGGKLWQWLATLETIRARDYLTAQHPCGIRWDTITSQNPENFVQSAYEVHLQMKTELFVFPASNKMSFQQHLDRVSASISLSWYFLGQTESCNHFSFQSAMGRLDIAKRGQSLCLQPQIRLH